MYNDNIKKHYGVDGKKNGQIYFKTKYAIVYYSAIPLPKYTH